MNRTPALVDETVDFSRQNITIPTTDPMPTTIVIPISKGEKCIVKKRAMPSSCSHIKPISTNQNKNKGSPIHAVAGERRNPSTTPTQRGRVCTK